MLLQRLFLWLSSLVFIGIGVALLGWPVSILASVDIHFETATAFADIRADYGGCPLGIGLFLAWCAFRPNRFRAGLFCVAFCMAGYVIGRVLSLAIDGTPKPIIYILLAIEACACLSAFGLLLMKNTAPVNNA